MSRILKVVIVVVLSIVGSCRITPKSVSRRFFRMDTITEITLVGKNKKEIEQLFKSADSLMVYWGEHFSVHGPKSEIRSLNERVKDTVNVSPIVSEMISRALAYGDTLEGGFDITILPLKELWGFGELATGNEPLPTDSAIKAALALVNYKEVKVQNDSVLFQSNKITIDVGGIAKGFVLRELRMLVEKYGINDYLIVAGGDIVSGGTRPDGNPWRIGVQNPRAQDSVLAAVSMDSRSVVTSGDYERFRIIDGKRYHHIFDSRSGYSCTKNQSVTIWGPDPVEVDVMSTGLFCSNADEILDFVNKRPRLECLVVDSSGGHYISDGLKNKIEIFGE